MLRVKVNLYKISISFWRFVDYVQRYLLGVIEIRHLVCLEREKSMVEESMFVTRREWSDTERCWKESRARLRQKGASPLYKGGEANTSESPHWRGTSSTATARAPVSQSSMRGNNNPERATRQSLQVIALQRPSWWPQKVGEGRPISSRRINRLLVNIKYSSRMGPISGKKGIAVHPSFRQGNWPIGPSRKCYAI